MKRIAVCLLLLSVVAAFAGCNRHTGMFLSDDNQGYFIELRPDGTCSAKEGPLTLTGKYEVKGDLLIMRFENGVYTTALINGNTITDRDGQKFIKGQLPAEVQDAKSGK